MKTQLNNLSFNQILIYSFLTLLVLASGAFGQTAGTTNTNQSGKVERAINKAQRWVNVGQQVVTTVLTVCQAVEKCGTQQISPPPSEPGEVEPTQQQSTEQTTYLTQNPRTVRRNSQATVFTNPRPPQSRPTSSQSTKKISNILSPRIQNQIRNVFRN